MIVDWVATSWLLGDNPKKIENICTTRSLYIHEQIPPLPPNHTPQLIIFDLYVKFHAFPTTVPEDYQYIISKIVKCFCFVITILIIFDNNYIHEWIIYYTAQLFMAINNSLQRWLFCSGKSL